MFKSQTGFYAHHVDNRSILEGRKEKKLDVYKIFWT